MFDLEKFKTGKYYVHLPTQEIYDDVMEFLDDNGFKWRSGDKMNYKNIWSRENKNTTITFDNVSRGGVYVVNLEKLLNNELKDLEGLKELELNETETINQDFAVFISGKDITNDILIKKDDEHGDFKLKQTGEIVYQQKNEQEYTKLMFENRTIYLDKNRKYGDAFTDTIKKYGYISAITRMNDKFNRIEQFTLNGFKDEEEGLRDSLMDLANYCYMYVMEIDREQEGKNE